MKDIQLFVPTFDVETCLQAVRKCLEKGWTGLGDQTTVLEHAFGTKFEHPYAHFVNSATSGLHLAVKILKDSGGWQDGDEIITTPLTFVSTNHAILYERLTPVFADIDQYLCMDPASAERLLGPRTRAVMFVGLGGNTGQFPAIVAFCRRHGLALILDAAHMTGTRLDGTNPGLAADATVYSFHAVKNLPTADAGMVCFTSAEHDARALRLSWLGIDQDTYKRANNPGGYKWKYEVDEIGFKYHGNSIMAAIAIAQLDDLEPANTRRRALCEIYAARLAQQPNIDVVPTAPNCVSARHLFQVRVAGRDRVIQELNHQRIFPGVHYRDNTEYAVYRDARGVCPNARLASDTVLSLPLHLRLEDSDVDRVAEALIAIVADTTSRVLV